MRDVRCLEGTIVVGGVDEGLEVCAVAGDEDCDVEGCGTRVFACVVCGDGGTHFGRSGVISGRGMDGVQVNCFAVGFVALCTEHYSQGAGTVVGRCGR